MELFREDGRVALAAAAVPLLEPLEHLLREDVLEEQLAVDDLLADGRHVLVVLVQQVGVVEQVGVQLAVQKLKVARAYLDSSVHFMMKKSRSQSRFPCFTIAEL